MKSCFIYLILIFTFFACQNERKQKKGSAAVHAPINVDTSNTDPNKTLPVEQADTLPKITKQNSRIKPEDKTVDISDLDRIPDPFEDPDYIGTPCYYLNGKCIRHNHKNEHREDSPSEIKGDSTNRGF